MASVSQLFEIAFKALVASKQGPVALVDYKSKDAWGGTSYYAYSVPIESESADAINKAAAEFLTYLESAFCEYSGVRVSSINPRPSSTGLYRRPQSITAVSSFVYDEEEDSRPKPPNLSGKPYTGPGQLYDIGFGISI